MRGIVERLNENIISDAFERRAIVDGALCERLIRERKEAAAEITRLRAENETLRRDVKTAVMGDSAELADVKRENEKLREALIGLYKPVFENPVEVGSALDLALRAAAAAIRESETKL